jgi:hypothetical protein
LLVETCVTMGNTEFQSSTKGKGKALQLQAWIGPLVFQEVEAPRISRQSAHEGGKVISLTHQPPLPPGDTPGPHFC